MPVTTHDLLTDADHPVTRAPCAGHAGAERGPDQHRDSTEVRAWARSRGYPIDESGAVPPQVLRTYHRVHAA